MSNIQEKKYLYNLGYHTYEESMYNQLYHNKKFTKEEFEELVIKIILKILSTHKHKRVSYQDIHFEVFEELINNFGFKEVEFEGEFSVFGWANLLDKTDWKRDCDETLEKIRSKILNL